MSFKASCNECDNVISADGHIVCKKCHTIVTTELATLKIENARALGDLIEHNEELEDTIKLNKDEIKNLNGQIAKLESTCDRLTMENDRFRHTRQIIANTLDDRELDKIFSKKIKE